MGVAAAAAAGLGLANFALNPVLAEDGGIRAGYKKMTNIPVPVTVTTLRFRADRHGRIEDPGRKPEPKPAKEEPAVEPTPPEPAAAEVPAPSEPASEEPSVEEPAPAEPASQEEVTEASAPASEEPSVEETAPAPHEEVTEVPAPAEPAAEEPAPVEPIVGEAASVEPVKEPAPAVEEPTPAVEEPAPAVEEPAPAVEEPAPAVEEPAPAAEVPTPAVEEPAPAAEVPAPAVEEPAPAAEVPAPAVEEPAPAAEVPAPAVEEPTAAAPPADEVAPEPSEPVAEDTAPAVEAPAEPVAEESAPVESPPSEPAPEEPADAEPVKQEPKSDEPVKEEAQDTASTILHSEEEVSKPEGDVAAAAVQAQESSDVVALPETDKEPAVITEPEQPATTESQESVATEVSKDSGVVRLADGAGEVEYAPYLLVGAGTASFAAFRAIKARDPTAKIIIVGEEVGQNPYMRPPLSKELWFPPASTAEEKAKAMREEQLDPEGRDIKFKQWNGRERRLHFEPDAFFVPHEELKGKKNGGCSVISGVSVERIDADAQLAYLSNGKKMYYGKCLIATGGKPKNLEIFKDHPELEDKITLYRTVKDFIRLHDLSRKVKDIVVIGGGFLGSELACALAARKDVFDTEVTQVYPEEGNMAKVLPQYLSAWTTNKVKAEGVNIVTKSRVESANVDPDSGKLVLKLDTGKELKTDHAIVAVGIQPDHQFAKNSGLEVDDQLGGFKVNSELEARKNLWVAGDAASFYDPVLGRRRVEHHDHAVVSGRLAGGNMAGDVKSYTHQSMFWSDLGPDVGYEAIGLVDSALPTVGVFAAATVKDSPAAAVAATDEAVRSDTEAASPSVNATSEAKSSSAELKAGEDYGKGVVFYLKEDVVVGVLMWNIFNKISIARKVLRENKKYEDLSEVAKLFDIHDLEDQK